MTLKVASHYTGLSSMATCLYWASISSVAGHMGTPHSPPVRAPEAKEKGFLYRRQISILPYPWEDTWRKILWRVELDAHSWVLSLLLLIIMNTPHIFCHAGVPISWHPSSFGSSFGWGLVSIRKVPIHPPHPTYIFILSPTHNEHI